MDDLLDADGLRVLRVELPGVLDDPFGLMLEDELPDKVLLTGVDVVDFTLLGETDNVDFALLADTDGVDFVLLVTMDTVLVDAAGLLPDTLPSSDDSEV